MAGAQKNFELLFKLTASLGGNFHSTFNAAVQAQKRLSDSVKNVNALQSKNSKDPLKNWPRSCGKPD